MPSKANKRQTRPATKRRKVVSSGGVVKKNSSKSAVKDPRQQEFSKFRHEIYKLGLEGFDKKDRIDARYELAIKLGAKPKSWLKPHKNLAEKTIENKQQKQKDNHNGKVGQIDQYSKINPTSSA